MSTEPQNKETTTAEVEGEEQRANGPSSTAEVARELERSEPGARFEQAATTLFQEEEANDFHKRWTDTQTGFVDEPRRAVEQADGLVAEVIKRLANSFAEARAELEGQWGRGDNVSTEDLRAALQRYRAFFDRLLNV
jgi:hypothetical protein